MSLGVSIRGPLLCMGKSQHEITENVSWNPGLWRLLFAVCCGELMQGISQGPERQHLSGSELISAWVGRLPNDRAGL